MSSTPSGCEHGHWPLEVRGQTWGIAQAWAAVSRLDFYMSAGLRGEGAELWPTLLSEPVCTGASTLRKECQTLNPHTDTVYPQSLEEATFPAHLPGGAPFYTDIMCLC